jgi:hypothetical protein
VTRVDAPVFDRLEALAGTWQAAAAMGLWAAAEAIILPVVPDVGLGLLVLAAPRRAWPLFAAVVVGAIVGTLALGIVAAQDPDAVGAILLRIPGIDAAIIADARAELRGDGVLGFAQIGIGTPLKVYTAEWQALGGDPAGLIAGTMLNRLTRIGPAILLAAAGGRLLAPWIRRHAGPTLVAYAAFWTLVYVTVLA